MLAAKQPLPTTPSLLFSEHSKPRRCPVLFGYYLCGSASPPLIAVQHRPLGVYEVSQAARLRKFKSVRVYALPLCVHSRPDKNSGRLSACEVLHCFQVVLAITVVGARPLRYRLVEEASAAAST